jgi:hypothetical protein
MTSSNNKKPMNSANERKKDATFPTSPTNEKKDDENAPLLPAAVQCPSLSQMPNRPPTTHPAATNNSEEKRKKMTTLEDMDKDKLSLKDKLTEEDKDKLSLGITGAQKISNGWVFFLYYRVVL